jgi:2Fe-2S ferredoxin
MPKVTVQPLGIEIEVPQGETIMSAAQALGYYWPTTCGGEGRCTTCACRVVSGGENLSPRGRSEERVLVSERGPKVLDEPVRLACQTQAYGDAVVEKPGVRRGLGGSLGSLQFVENKE